MLARLMFRGRDFDPRAPQPWNAEALTQDLGLEPVAGAMARGDGFLAGVARAALLSAAENDLETVLYRQRILQDCLDHPEAARALYAVAMEAVEAEKRHYLVIPARHPDWVLRSSAEELEAFLGPAKKLRALAGAEFAGFAAEGWVALREGLQRDLSDAALARIEAHLEQLKFRQGMTLGARLGAGNKGTGYALLRPRPGARPGWRERLLGPRGPASEFTLDPRDESGIQALEELQNRGLVSAANALARAAGHVRRFFQSLRTELAFYIGCLNLRERLARLDAPVCVPAPAPAGERRLSFRGLYDVSLALSVDRRVVGNDVDADLRHLTIVTGANQGGKSTFLRSVGLAQLMLQAGMFAPAEALSASLRGGVFTHYRREEDAGMNSGKLDEELSRMSEIVGRLAPHPLILFNESFAATNEREGSEIARQVLAALLDSGAKMVCVTHLYTLASDLYRNDGGRVLFLRAERAPDGTRPFKLVAGEPLQTSFGADLYRSVFGARWAR